MIEKLLVLNEILLKRYELDEKMKNKYTSIQKILSTKDCFLKMNIEHAYAILRDLGIPENEIQKVYMELISPPVA